MFEKIKKFFVRKALAKVETNRADRCFVNWENAQRIQILYYADVSAAADAKSPMVELNKIQNDLNKQGKRHVFVIYSEVPVFYSSLDNVLFFSKNDFSSLNMCPKKEVLTEFRGYDADLLVNLSTEECTQLEFFAAASFAKMKATSLPKTDLSANYDFVVAPNPEEDPTNAIPKSPLSVFKSIRYYLETIKPA